MGVRRQWNEIFKVLGGKHYQPRILYLAKLCFKNEGEIKNTKDIQWRKEESLQQMVLGQLQRNEIGPLFHTRYKNQFKID